MTRSLRRRLVAVPVAVVLLGLASASPASARFVAIGTDATGDATDGDPSHDIVDVGIQYDRRTGRLEGGSRLAASEPGAPPARLQLVAGMRTATGCHGYPAIGFNTQTNFLNVDWFRLNRPNAAAAAQGAGNKDYEGAVEEYQAADTALRGLRPQCVVAQLANAENPAIVYDVAGPFAVKAFPELTLELGRVPGAMRVGETRKVRVVLHNVGDAPTGKLRLKVRGARGLRVKLSQRIGSLKAGKRKVVTARVGLASNAKRNTVIRATATGKNKLQARDEASIQKIERSGGGSNGGSGGSGGGGGTGGGPNLCYRYTWYPPYGELVPC